MEKASKAKLKEVREILRDKDVRDSRGMFVAEGRKIVSDIIRKGHVIESVIVSSAFLENNENADLLQDMENRFIPVHSSANAEFERLSSLQNSQGILAIVKKPDQPAIMPDTGKDEFVILCDGIQDPGNLGAIIRTAVAFGADTFLLAGDAADIYNPKVVRASSGTVLDVRAYGCDKDEVDRLKESGYSLFAASVTAKGTTDIKDIKELPGRSIIAFGSEGKGLSSEIDEKADMRFYIPIGEKVESLNVTAAAAIVLHAFSVLKK